MPEHLADRGADRRDDRTLEEEREQDVGTPEADAAKAKAKAVETNPSVRSAK